MMEEVVKNFKIIIPKVVAKPVKFVPSKINTKHQKEVAYERFLHQKLMQHKNVN
jgi:helicase SWR1